MYERTLPPCFTIVHNFRLIILNVLLYVSGAQMTPPVQHQPIVHAPLPIHPAAHPSRYLSDNRSNNNRCASSSPTFTSDHCDNFRSHDLVTSSVQTGSSDSEAATNVNTTSCYATSVTSSSRDFAQKLKEEQRTQQTFLQQPLPAHQNHPPLLVSPHPMHSKDYYPSTPQHTPPEQKYRPPSSLQRMTMSAGKTCSISLFYGKLKSGRLSCCYCCCC